MQEYSKISPRLFLLRLFQGILIGVGGVLPGVSGGVLCIIFGLYQPAMEVLASPRKNLRRHLSVLIPALIGMGIGFFLFVRAISAIMVNYSEAASCLFAGMILGTLPSMIRTANKKAPSARSVIAFFISFVLLFSLFLLLEHEGEVQLRVNCLWYLFTGAILGIGTVFPGLSSSSILISLGLFEPMLYGVKHFDFGVLIPLAIGCAAAIVLLSKLVSRLFERHYSVMNYIVIGATLATTIPIIPTHFSSAASFAIDILLFAVGVAAAFLFEYLSQRLEKRQ